MKVWRAERAGQFGRGGNLLSRFNLDGTTVFYVLCGLMFVYYLWWQFGPKPANSGEVAATVMPTATINGMLPTIIPTLTPLPPDVTPTETETPTPTITPTPTPTGILPTAFLRIETVIPPTPSP